MTREEMYDAVNKCETVDELMITIVTISDADGHIQGKARQFDATKMAGFVKGVVEGHLPPNLLTREFGIRQQALYLAYYKEHVV